MPPKIPTTGRLSVKSNPQDAEIFINFKDTDLKTPQTLSLPIGANLITLKKDNYADFSFCVEISENETLEKNVKLHKPTVKPVSAGELSIESVPSHAEICVDLEDTHLLTPEKLTLPEGAHLITLRMPDSEYDDLHFCAKIEKGEHLEKFLELKKSTGELTITSTPTASNIWLKEYDDLKSRDTGFVTPQTLTLTPTPLEKPISITLKREGYEDFSFDVEIKKGIEIEKFAELVKAEEEALGPIPPGKSRIRILSKPTYASIYTGEEDTGKITPESFTLDPGDFSFTLKREGYEDKTILVTLEEGKELEKFVELTKAEGVVQSSKSGVKITSKPSSVSIHISDKITSPLSTLTNLFPPVEDTKRITPELLILEPGLYGISLRKEGYEDRNVFVTIEEGKELEKFIELVKVEGVVSAEESGVKIVTKPTAASIFVNGKDINRITPELIILDPEEYEITVKKEGYEDKTVTITIEEGKQIEKFIQLARIEGAARPDKSGVKLTSKPTAASIFINGKDTDRITPELVLLEPGEHQITLKKPGYLDKTAFITVEEGKEIERYIELTKVEEPEPLEKTGVKIVSKPSSASIYLNGEDTGRITPELILLDPGTYTVTLRKEGYNSRTVTIVIQEGKELEKFVELSKTEAPDGKDHPVGELHIESRPELAEIWEGGSNLKLLTPETLTLTPGAKNILLKKSGFDDYTFSIKIVAGEKSEKVCELIKSTGEVFVSSRPSRAKIFVNNKDTHLLTPEKLILSPGKKRIELIYPAFLSAMYYLDIVKGGKTEIFHRFIIPRDAIKINKDDSFDDNIHVRDYCMQCDNPPEYDVLFSEGNLRAWLCAEHCKVFVRESSEKINAIRRIDNGKATSKFRENINPNVLSRFIRDMQRTSQKKQLATDEELAPVNASGVELGKKITLKEILPYFKSFYHTKPYVSLTGGVCNRGSTTGDIDIFINSNHRDIATEFRIIRSFPQDYWYRFNFRYPYQEKTHPGKFTNHVDIYDEKIEAIREPELVLMSAPKKVELFKTIFRGLKPAHGHYKGEEYSIDKLLEVVNAKPEWYEKGIYAQKKFDGVDVRCDVQRNYESGYDVIIWSEEGNDITKNLPTLRKELGEASKGHAMSIVGELEFWKDEKHQSRQQTTAIIHTKEVHPDEKKVVLNTFDILFYDKDIHNEPYSERLKILDKIKETEHIKKAPYTLVKSPTELRKAVEHYSDLPGSEGTYLKRADFPYELDGKSLLNLKYKNTLSIDAKVIDVHKVKDANAFNYLCVVEDDKGKDVPIGRTYNTSIKVSKGDILKVEFVNLNKYETEDGKVWYNWWSPHVIMAREDKKKPDNTRTALKLVEASHGTVAEKPWPKRYEDDSYPLLDWKQPYQPSKSTNKQLADDWRLFVAAVSNLDAGKDEPFTYKDIYTWATACLKEIAKRVKDGSMKFSISKEKSEAYKKLFNAVSKKVNYKPLNNQDAPGIYLVSPHAELIAAGEKTLIVKSRDFSNQCDQELILCSSGLCFGTLKMKLPREAARDELEELYPLHRITPDEIKDWWPEIKKFYLYDIYDVSIWDKPRHADIPQGVQTFIKNVKLTDADKDQDCGKAWEVLFANGMALQYFKEETDADHFIASGKKDPEWFDFNRKRFTWVKREKKAPHHCWPVNKKPIEWTASEKDSYIDREELAPANFSGDADPYLVYPDETKKWKGMVHCHGRGRSVHLDFRAQISEDYATGWTLYIPKGLSKVPESFGEFKRLVDTEIMPLVKKTMSDPMKKFNCGKKAPEPIEWLSYEGMVQPGEIGATKNEPGFFYIIDSFEAQFGAQKSYFHEYFCDGKIFNGRMVFTLLENKEEWKKTDEGLMTWMMFSALKSPTPYTISNRAAKKAWVPPFEASALPRNIRSKVPEKFRYWKEKDKKKRLEIRDELVDEIKKKQVKVDSISQGDAEFKFIKQTWRGQKVIREGPSRTLYYIILKQDKSYFSLALNTSLLSSQTASGLPFRHPTPLWTAEGEIKPGTKLNPTKATPSKIGVLDQGKAIILIEDKVKKFILKGKKLKGTWFAFQHEDSKLWTIEKSEPPKPKK